MRLLRLPRIAVLALLLANTPSLAQTRPATATDDEGRERQVRGEVVLVEPDIQLYLLTAGGLPEPREEWTRDARRFYAASVRDTLAEAGTPQRPDFDVPDDLDPDSRLGQILRLNEAVALSISQFLMPGNALATKRDAQGKPRLDWTLGPGVAALQAQTGADFALFTYVRDSYASGGRTALRVLGLLAGAAVGAGIDIGGGMQVGVAILVDLRTGEVVWFNQMARQTGDLRDAEGSERTVRLLLKDLPL